MARQARRQPGKLARTFDALPDTIDFRDALFSPTLIRIPALSDLEKYRAYGIPVLDQGAEGACTGFGLATVANYLLRVRGQSPTADEVSAWMLYAMAKRYDEWPGENYEGSSARGAMKGWLKHGLCALALWREREPDPSLEAARSADALARPLGAYYRVNHKDLVAMHSAITEGGVLYATAKVHEGWQAVRPGDDTIEYLPGIMGGHAFAIVGYDRDGLWIQNSWGPNWGASGLARLTYADWLANGTDVWVAALGAPVDIRDKPTAAAAMRAGAPRSYESRIYADLRPHIITSKNNGVLDDKGTYGLTEKGLETLLTTVMPQRMDGWAKKRVLLYAHGGLVPEDSAVQTISNNLGALLAAEVYPLSFIWRSDAWSTIRNILTDVIASRRDEGFLDGAKDFMLDRLDDTLEVVARRFGGKALWDEMKENAAGATSNRKGAARLAADLLADLYDAGKLDEIHIVGHSAGSIFMAPFADRLTTRKVPIKSLSLWAPACTIELFEKSYKPQIDNGIIEAFDLYTLDDATEQDDNCANVYHKSLLYLVSNAFEESSHIPGIQDGTPLLGLQRCATKINKSFWKAPNRTWNVAPGAASLARHHGDFDDDKTTLLSTLNRIIGKGASRATASAARSVNTRSVGAQRAFRQRLEMVLGTAPSRS